MGSGQSSGQQNAGMSAQLMQSGWGKALLIAVGLGFVAVGGYHVYKGASKKFLKDLRVSGGTGITAVGVTGYVAKGPGAGRHRRARDHGVTAVRPVEVDWPSTPRSRRSARRRSARSC